MFNVHIKKIKKTSSLIHEAQTPEDSHMMENLKLTLETPSKKKS